MQSGPQDQVTDMNYSRATSGDRCLKGENTTRKKVVGVFAFQPPGMNGSPRIIQYTLVAMKASDHTRSGSWPGRMYEFHRLGVWLQRSCKRHFVTTFNNVIKLSGFGLCITEHVAAQSLVHDCTFPLNDMGSLKLIRKLVCLFEYDLRGC